MRREDVEVWYSEQRKVEDDSRVKLFQASWWMHLGEHAEVVLFWWFLQ